MLQGLVSAAPNDRSHYCSARFSRGDKLCLSIGARRDSLCAPVSGRYAAL